MDGFFKLQQNKTTVATEVKAGLTAAFAMLYIMMVNAGMLSSDFIEGHASFGAIYIATGLGAIVGTVAIGLLSQMPFAQASGMGLNAFFTYTVCLTFGFTYANALACVLVEGVIFILLTVTGARKAILEAIPSESVRKTISMGIGAFIMFLGFQDSGLVMADSATGVTLASFNILNGGKTLADIIPLILAFVGTVGTCLMLMRGQKDGRRPISGSILWGIIGVTLVYYLLMALLAPETVQATFDGLSLNPFPAFEDWWTQSFGVVFTKGFDFSAYAATHGVVNTAVSLFTTMLAFMMVDMYDTLGTLQGTVSTIEADLSDDQMNKAMLADAIGTTAGAIFGTSTVTTYVESSAAFIAGGRTGLSSLVTAGVFFISLFLSPIASLIPSCAYSTALITVGIIMIKSNWSKVDWEDWEVTVPAMLTFFVMPFTYNISYGIAAGLFSYILIKVFRGKSRDVKGVTWLMSGLFLLMLLTSH